MSNLFGGGGNNKAGVSSTGYGLTGGGLGAPWEWGVSQFDQNQINNAVSSDTTAIQDRYNQLGLGGSTMEGQDVTGASDMGQAMTGGLQTQNVGNPAMNPALQPQLNWVSNVPQNQTNSLSSLASSAAGKAIGSAAGTVGSDLATAALAGA